MPTLTPITNPSLVPEFILGLNTINQNSTATSLISSRASAFLIAPGIGLSAAHNFTDLATGQPDLSSFTVNPRTTNILTSTPFGPPSTGTFDLFTDYNPQDPNNGSDLGDDVALIQFSGNSGGARPAQLVVFQREFDALDFTNSVQVYGYDTNGQLLTGVGDVGFIDASTEGDAELLISGIDTVRGISGGSYEFDISLPYLNNISVNGVGAVHVGEGSVPVANPFSIQDYFSIAGLLFASGVNASDVESPQIILNSQSPNPLEASFNGTYLNETVYGSNASQTINGGDGSDLVFGSNGSDILIGGNEAFTIDTLDYSSYASSFFDTLVEVEINGIDNVSVSKFLNIDFGFFGSNPTSILIGSDLVSEFEFIHGSDSNDTFEITNITADMTISGGDGFDTLILSDNLQGAIHNSFTDTITLNGFTISYVGFESIDDNIPPPPPPPPPPGTGTNGNDILNGTSGSDALNGFGGNDRLNGGAGNDFLNGGSGNDILNGGSGIDTAIFDTNPFFTANADGSVNATTFTSTGGFGGFFPSFGFNVETDTLIDIEFVEINGEISAIEDVVFDFAAFA